MQSKHSLARKDTRLTTELSAPNPNPNISATVTRFNSMIAAVGLELAGSITLDGTSPWGFEMWISLDTASADQQLLISCETNFAIATQNGAIVVVADGQNVLVTESLLVADTWYYIVVSYDGSTLSIWLDGKVQATLTQPYTAPGAGGSTFIVGSVGGSGGFYGEVELVRCWSAAINTTSLLSHQYVPYPASTNGLLAQMDFTQNPPVDTSGNGTQIIPSASGVELVTFAPVLALAEEGSAVPSGDTSVNPGGALEPFTVMAWIAPAYIESNAPVQVIFSNGTYGSTGMSLAIDGNGYVLFRVGDSDVMQATGGALVAGDWANVAVTYSTASTPPAASIYVNGAFINSQSLSSSTSLASGAPLIGATVTENDGVSAGFAGFIESVNVFDVALDASQISEAQTANPLNTAACIANYDFTLPKHQNHVTRNPVGLVGGASLVTVPTVPAGMKHSTPVQQEMREDALPGVPVPGLTAEHFSEARRAELLADYRRFMTERFGIAPERQEEYAQMFAANFDRAAADFAAGTYRAPFTIESRRNADGTTTLIMHTSEGSGELVSGVFSPCDTWLIDFIFAIVGTLLTALGFVKLKLPGPAAGNYLIKVLNAIRKSLQKIFAKIGSGNVTASTLFDVLLALWSAGALTPLLKFFWEVISASLSWWTIFVVCIRLALFFSPWAELEAALLVAQLAYGVATVIQVWEKKGSCFSSDLEAAA